MNKEREQALLCVDGVSMTRHDRRAQWVGGIGLMTPPGVGV